MLRVSNLSILFTAVWCYYALSVPLDLLLGLHIQVLAQDSLPDLNEPVMAATVWLAVGYYFTCLVGFWSTYLLSPGSTHVPDRSYSWPLPPLWLLVTVSGLAALQYVAWGWGVDRQTRSLMGRDNVADKIMTLNLTFAMALNVIYIVTTKDRRRCLAAVGVGCVLGVVNGGRMEVLVFPLIFAIRYRIRFTFMQLASALICVWVFLAYWKSVYGELLGWYSGRPVSVSNVVGYETLSGLEAVDSFRMLVAFIREGTSPLWLGSSYVNLTAQVALPRFLMDAPARTLAEQYVAEFHLPRAMQGGGMGFSAVAEAWLNFGVIGPALLGVAVGVLAKRLDSRPRGIVYYIAVILMVRLFRSDFASLVKSWIIVFGGSVAIITGVLASVSALSLRRRVGVVRFRSSLKNPSVQGSTDR